MPLLPGRNLYVIRERRAKPGDHGDILQMLLDALDEDDGRTMTDRQVRDEVMTLFLAGHESMSNALSWSLCLLTRHPEIHARLYIVGREVVDEVGIEGQLFLAHLAQQVSLTAPGFRPPPPLPRVTLRPGGPIHLTVARRA